MEKGEATGLVGGCFTVACRRGLLQGPRARAAGDSHPKFDLSSGKTTRLT